MVTRVTFRINDSEFGRQLDELLSKTKMSQQDFFTMLSDYLTDKTDDDEYGNMVKKEKEADKE